MSTKDIKDAQQFWSFVLDTNKFKSSKSSITQASLRKIIADVSTTDFDVKAPRKDVILVAQFIANIDPSYKNSEGRYVELTALRTQTGFSEEDINFLCEKIEGIVKPFITVTNTTKVDGLKLKIKSLMPKKKLIHAAVRHLLLGSELFKNPANYHEVKARSLFMNNIKASYAWLVGLALALQYPSVPTMMEDMCLKFIDQTNNINNNGQVIFYDGSLRIENL